MSFRFRFPQAILNYLDEAGNDTKLIQNTIEKAREFAVPEQGERRKRPTLLQTEEWIEQLKAERFLYA